MTASGGAIAMARVPAAVGEGEPLRLVGSHEHGHADGAARAHGVGVVAVDRDHRHRVRHGQGRLDVRRRRSAGSNVA